MVVSAAPLTVTGSGTQVYGGSPSYSASYNGFVLSQNASVLGGSLSYSTTTSSSSNVGTYNNAVTPGGLISSNYAISFAPGAMVVGAAPLTVTGSGTQVYGGSPSYSASYNGFVLSQGQRAGRQLELQHHDLQQQQRGDVQQRRDAWRVDLQQLRH